MIISEIFCSIQGESLQAGLTTVFIRTGGCNLDCLYCDTRYARKGGDELDTAEVCRQARAFNVKHITITGGEPLLQEDCIALCAKLIAEGCRVQVETNGSCAITEVPEQVRIIMDIKTPGSGMAEMNNPANIAELRAHDEIKFVLTSEDDYHWALAFIQDSGLNKEQILFSAAKGFVEPAVVADWMVRDRINDIRFQLQLHTVLWPGERGR